MIAWIYSHNWFEHFVIKFSINTFNFTYSKQNQNYLLSFSFKIRDIVYTPIWLSYDKKLSYLLFNKIDTNRLRNIPKFRIFDMLIKRLSKKPNRVFSSLSPNQHKLREFETFNTKDSIQIHHESNLWNINLHENNIDMHTILNSKVILPYRSNIWFLRQIKAELERKIKERRKKYE